MQNAPIATNAALHLIWQRVVPHPRNRVLSIQVPCARIMVSTLGRRQVVRQRPLEPIFGGSNPSAPACFFPVGREIW